MLSRRQFLIASMATASTALLGGCYATDRLPAERAVAFDIDDVITPTPQWASYGENLAKANANTISISVGRPDLLAFDWAEYPDTSAQLVRDTGNDLVEQALIGLEPHFPDGYQLCLNIDTLVPDWISRDSTLAGTTTTGLRSPNRASLSALCEGAVAERLAKLVVLLCQRYEPHRIVLSQLFFDNATFGPEDLTSYTTTMGAGDWPRRNDGSIDEAHASIGQWRSKSLAKLLSRLKAETHRFNDTQLDVEAQVNWEEHAGGVPMIGHNYDTLLEGADRILVSNDFGTRGESPTYSGKMAKTLSNKFPERFGICTGLWSSDSEAVSPDDLGTSLAAAAKGGAQSVCVAPGKLMTPGHWATLTETWAET